MLFQDLALRLKLVGIANMEVAAGQTGTATYNFSERTVVTGAEYFRTGNASDTVTMNVKHNGQTVASFATDIYLSSEGRYEFYQAIFNSGHSLEIVYKNNGTEAAKLRCNLISHVDKV